LLAHVWVSPRSQEKDEGRNSEAVA